MHIFYGHENLLLENLRENTNALIIAKYGKTQFALEDGLQGVIGKKNSRKLYSNWITLLEGLMRLPRYIILG